MEVLFYCLIGAAIGLLIGFWLFTPKPDGAMVLDETDPEKDLYRLELTIPIDDIPKRRFITLKVKQLRN